MPYPIFSLKHLFSVLDNYPIWKMSLKRYKFTMSASYPTSVKTFINPGANSLENASGLEHDVQHADANNEINAIETELGAAPKTITEATTPAASPSSVAEFLDMVATQLKAISGGTHWYSAIGTTLASIVSTVSTLSSTVTSHTGNTSNPHSTTASQVGLGNVTNVAQVPSSYLDTDGTLAANSDSKVATQKATKTYADSLTVAKVKTGKGSVTSNFATSSTSYVDLTGASVSITTTVTCNILVILSGESYNNGLHFNYFKLLRDSTALGENTEYQDTVSAQHIFSMQQLDLAVAAGTYTYKAQMKVDAGTGTVVGAADGGDNTRLLVIAIPN